jgi:DNA-binding PadR family transcriptional regulator
MNGSIYYALKQLVDRGVLAKDGRYYRLPATQAEEED